MDQLKDKKEIKAEHERAKSPFQMRHDLPKPTIERIDEKEPEHNRDAVPSHLAPPKLSKPKLPELEDMPEPEERHERMSPPHLKPLAPPRLGLPPEEHSAEPPKPTWGQARRSNANVFRKPNK